MTKARPRNTVVLDTNLVVSAFLRPDGAAAQALLCALQGFDVVASSDTLAELQDVLQRDKFERYLPKATRLAYARTYTEAVRLVEVHSTIQDCADPKDDKFLALAVDAQANLLVSGDKKDLLAMHPYQGVRILSIRAFLAEYAQAQ